MNEEEQNNPTNANSSWLCRFLCSFVKDKLYQAERYWLRRRYLRAKEKPDAKVARATIWLAILTCALVVVGSLQWYTLNSQLTETKEEQRAFVFFKEVKINPDPMKKYTMLISPYWENSGNTPTKKLQIDTFCPIHENTTPKATTTNTTPTNNAATDPDITRVSLPANFIDPYMLKDITPHVYSKRGILGPKQIEMAGGCSISQRQIQRINQNDDTYYLASDASYRDILDPSYEHRTEFCAKIIDILEDGIDQTNGQVIWRINLTSCDDHNCADEECSDK